MRRYLDQRLKLQMLRSAEAVETHGSIIKAAAALGISQPALTKCLHELEDIVQARLFDRHTRGARATEAGLRLVIVSRRILAEVSRLEDDLDLLGAPDSGIVAVGALPVTAVGLLPDVLARLKRRHPRVQVRLQQGKTEELLPLLASGELDLIVGRLYEPAKPDGLLREPLWSEPIALLARTDHPIFDQEAATIDDVRRFELVLPTVSQRVGQEIEHVLALLDLIPAASLRSNSHGFIRETMHSSDVICIMPKLMMVGDLLRGTLKVVPVPFSSPERPAGLILPKRRPLPGAGTVFVDCLRDYVGEISDRGFVAPPNANTPQTLAEPPRCHAITSTCGGGSIAPSYSAGQIHDAAQNGPSS